MRELITTTLSGNAPEMFLNQVITTLVIIVFGYLAVSACSKAEDESVLHRISLAFPFGIAVFSVVGSIVLIVGIPYRRVILLIACLIVAVACIAVLYSKDNTVSVKNKLLGSLAVKGIVILLIATVAIVLYSCSGYSSISISNDSMYYFWIYPKYIVKFEGLRDQFDVFLTDTGLGMAVFGTLPFLFGFGETFGMQEAFHISFLVYFWYATKNMANQNGQSDKAASVIATMATVLLGVCTPVYILAHWSMANVFFMEFMFIVIHEAWIRERPIKLAVLLCSMSLFRMEGGMQCLFLIVCIALLDYSATEISIYMLAPAALLQGMYTYKIYTQYVFDSPYMFLTPRNAAVQIAAFAAVAVYLLLIIKHLPKIFKKHLPTCYILALLAGNVLLFIADSHRYIVNVVSILRNMFRQSGWGIMPYFVTAFAVLLLAEALLCLRKNGLKGLADSLGGCETNSLQTGGTIRDVTYFALVTVGYALMSVALLWARGSELNENVGDSGNRVFLQIAPLVIFLLVRMVIWLIREKTDCEKA